MASTRSRLDPSRYDLTRDDLAEVLAGEPRYRVEQVWDGLHRQGREPGDLTNLPRALRERLGHEPRLAAALDLADESLSDDGATVKWLWRLRDGADVETVLMRYPDRVTACVSTQAGCAMACTFCATGQAGFTRNLTPGEIVEQVVRARRRAAEEGCRLGNVVFMGMGEPLANYDALVAAVRRLHDDLGISARHLTVSTVGIVPAILRLASEGLPLNLAVSLHGADDATRDELVPINRRYPIARLVEACRHWNTVTGRRLSFEWALIAGVNDRPRDAQRLAALAVDLHAHVNLIPLNPTPGFGVPGTPPDGVRAFRDRLRTLGVNVTVRRNRGNEIDAACGQLAGRRRAAPVVLRPRRR